MRFLISFLFILFSIVGFSQTIYPTNQWFGSASTLTEFKGAGKAAHGFINGVYADTSLANLAGYLRFYPGAQIMAGDSMYFRNLAATAWLIMNGSGGGGGGTWGTITGTLSNQTDLQTALNLKANLASPTFTGTPTLPTGTIGVTQSAGNSTTGLATTAFVTTADNLKANIASPTFTGTVVIPSPFTLGATSVLTSGDELNFVDGVTSNIQTQLDAKLSNVLTTTGDIIISSSGSTAARLAAGTAAYVLTSNGAGVAPSWQVLPSDNLLFDSLGAAGISPMTTWNNTLYARRISISGGSIDTTASGGLLITVAAGGSGLFPTTGTGTATGAVIGSLAGNTFNINQGANSFLSIDPTAGAEAALLRAFNTTGDDNYARVFAQTTNTSSQIELSASFNGEVDFVGITGTAASGVSTLEYTADTHTFTGAVTFADLAGNGVGIVGSSNAGLTSFITVGTGLDLTAGVLTATGGGGGTFVGLTDGPGAFAGQAGKSVRVNVGETALEYFTAAGSGDVIKVGTPVNNQLGIWTGDGTIEGDANLTFASSTLSIGVAGAATGILTLSGVTSGTITIQPASAAGTYTLTLPTTDGASGEFLQTDGNGVLTWAAGGGVLDLSYDATNHEVDISGGGTSAVIPLAVDDGATEGLASFTATDFTVTAGNVVIDYANGQAASASLPGYTTTGTQTFAGNKTIGTLTVSTALFSLVAFRTNSTADNGNFHVVASNGTGTSTTAEYQIGGSTTVGFRTAFRGAVSTTQTANVSYAGFLIGSQGATEAASGTHSILAGAAVNAPVFTNGSGLTTDATSFYISGPPTGTAVITNAITSLWVDAGVVRFDGGILGTATNDAATAGNVGEEVVAIQSTYTNYTTTATYQEITSITLTAGDWDISSFMTYSSNSATITAASNAIFVISTTTASAAGAVEGRNISYVPQAALLGTSLFSESISPYRVSISGSTTYYLNTQATFTLGNPQYVGGLRARRLR